MREKLILATALLTLTVSTDVKANNKFADYIPPGGYYGYDDPNTPTGDPRVWGFRTDWEKGRDFGARPIKKGDNDITVKTVPEAVLTVKKWESNDWKNIPQKKNTTLNSNEAQKTLSVANGAGLAVFYLDDEYKPKVGDKYRLTLTFGGFYLAGGEWTVGESIPRDEEEKDEAEIQKFIGELERKEKEAEAQKNALELFEQQQQEEANKTWYQRLGDSIQDQWWNFKGWWRE